MSNQNKENTIGVEDLTRGIQRALTYTEEDLSKP